MVSVMTRTAQPRTIGEFVRIKRGERGMTQAELARAVGVATATINRIENQARRPQASTLVRLAAALGVDPTELDSREAS